MVRERNNIYVAVLFLSPSAMSTGVDFATAVKQEAAYLRLVHPTPDDIPSCFRLMELAMGCHGTALY